MKFGPVYEINHKQIIKRQLVRLLSENSLPGLLSKQRTKTQLTTDDTSSRSGIEMLVR
jgi:hypothetical protein